MKKVLEIVSYCYLPVRTGGQKSIAQFLEYLGRETDLTVISVQENDSSFATTYKLLPFLKNSSSRYFEYSLVKKISTQIKANKYEAVIWDHPYYAWLAYMVKKKTGIRTIIRTHNTEHLRFRSLGKWWWPLLRIYEKWSYKIADHLFFVTPEDRMFAIKTWKIPAEKCTDIPFGVAAEKFPIDKEDCKKEIHRRHNIDKENKVLLFNGALDYKPNTDAIRDILEKINPLLLHDKSFKYKILICGKGLPAEFDSLRAYADKNIIYAGFVDDIETYFKGSDIFLNPVLTGGGIKTKMVEAIAYGTTVISTENGAAGIDRMVAGEKLIVVNDNDWKEFAGVIIKAGTENNTTSGSYYSTYNWKNIIDRVIQVI